MHPVRDATADEVVANCNFLLDTNIISHVIRPKKRIDPGIERFLNTVDEMRMYLSIVTFGEIEKGIGLIPWPDDESARTERARLQAVLEQRLEQLSDRFAGRIIDVNMQVARQWGRLHAKNERVGRKTPVVDTLIAACALTNHLIVATADADFGAFELITAYNPISHTLTGHSIPNYFPAQR